jgi:hypothetical protein
MACNPAGFGEGFVSRPIFGSRDEGEFPNTRLMQYEIDL